MVRFPLPRAEGVSELIDESGTDLKELSANLRDLERINRLFGGTRLILRYLKPMIHRHPAREVHILDVATGGADIPVAIAQWARGQRRQVRIVGVDKNPQVLRAAAERIQGYPEVILVAGDALALPYPPQSFDIVLCSLTLHHLTYPEGVRLLVTLDRIGRWGFIINDLLRSWHGYGLTWLAMHLFCRGRLVRHDGPLSIRRAYTLPELREMVKAAGIQGVEIRSHPFFRVTLVKEQDYDRTGRP